MGSTRTAALRSSLCEFHVLERTDGTGTVTFGSFLPGPLTGLFSAVSANVFCNFNFVFSFPFVPTHVHSCSFIFIHLHSFYMFPSEST